MRSDPAQQAPSFTPGRIWPHVVAPIWFAVNFSYGTFSAGSMELSMDPFRGIGNPALVCFSAFLMNPLMLGALGFFGGRHRDTICHVIYAGLFVALVVLTPGAAVLLMFGPDAAARSLIHRVTGFEFAFHLLIYLVVYAMGFGLGRIVARHPLGE